MRSPRSTASKRRFLAFSQDGLARPNPPSGDEHAYSLVNSPSACATPAPVRPSLPRARGPSPSPMRRCWMDQASAPVNSSALEVLAHARRPGGQATLPQQSVAKVLACGQAPRRNLIADQPLPAIHRRGFVGTGPPRRPHSLCNSAFPIPSSKNGLLIAIGLRFARLAVAIDVSHHDRPG
jgi:hypothetical protein